MWRASPSTSTPGTQSIYSNFGFSLLGPLPDATGQDLPAYNWAGLLDSDSSIMVRRADGLSMVC